MMDINKAFVSDDLSERIKEREEKLGDLNAYLNKREILNDEDEEDFNDSEDDDLPQLSEPLSLSQQSEALKARHERLRAAMRQQQQPSTIESQPLLAQKKPTIKPPFKISNLPIGVFTLMLAVTLTVYQFATQAGGGRRSNNSDDPLFDKLIGDRLDLTVSAGSGLASEDAAQDWGMLRSLLQNHATLDPRAIDPLVSSPGGAGNGKRNHRMSQLDGRRPLGSGAAPPFTEGAIEIADARVGFGGGQRVLFVIARHGWLQPHDQRNGHLNTPLVIATVEEKGVRGGGPFQQASHSGRGNEHSPYSPIALNESNVSKNKHLNEAESLKATSPSSNSHPTMPAHPRGRSSTRHSPRRSILSLFSKIFKSHDDGERGAYRGGGGGKKGERERGKAARAFNAQQRGPGLAAREKPDFEPLLVLHFHAHIASVTCKLTNSSSDLYSTENLIPDCPIDEAQGVLELGPLSLKALRLQNEQSQTEKGAEIPLWLSKLKGVLSDIQRLKMATLTGPDGSLLSHFYFQAAKSVEIKTDHEKPNDEQESHKEDLSDVEVLSNTDISSSSSSSSSSPASTPPNSENVEL